MTSYNLRKIIVWLQLVLQNANIFVFRPFTFITPKTAKNNVSIDCYLSLATNPLFRATKQITRDGDWRGMWDKAALCWRDNNNVSWWMCRRRVSSEVIYVFLLCSGVLGATSSETFDWGRVARHGSRPAPQTRWPILCCAAQQCHHIQCHTLLLYLAHHKINTMMLFNPKTILETWHDNDNVHLLIFTQLDLCIYWGLIFSNVLIWQVLPSKLCSFDGVKNAQKNRFHFYLNLWLRSTSPPSS